MSRHARIGPVRAVAIVALATLAGCLVPPEALPEPAAADEAPETFAYVPPGAAAAVVARLAAQTPGLAAGKPNPEVESAIAVDPADPQHLVAFHIERTEPYLTGNGLLEPRRPGLIAETLAVSRDGGASWTSRSLPQMGSATPPSKWALYCTLADPNVFFDDESVVHIVTLASTCSAPGYLVMASEQVIHATTQDDGATWSEPDVVWVGAGGSAVWLHDRQWAARDPASGRLIAAWTTFHGFLARTALSVAVSDDDGRTWSPARELDTAIGLDAHNHLVHIAFGPDGLARIATHGGADGRRLAVFVGDGGGRWDRVEVPICDGAPADGFYDYPSTSVDRANVTAVAAGVFTAGGPAGVCVHLVGADGAGSSTWIPGAEHPWLDRAPDGALALAHLANGEGGVATPTLTLLDPASLGVTASLALGEAYDVDVEDDGARETSHYDTMVWTGEAFVWTLTRPNADGRTFDGATVDLDIWAYRATIEAGATIGSG